MRRLVTTLAGLICLASAGGGAQEPGYVLRPVSPNPLAPQLNSVRLLDAQHALAVGEHGALLRSDDGGLTWTRVGSASEAPLHGVAAAGPIAIAVGDSGTILRSADNASTFQRVSSQIDVELRSVALSNSGLAIAVGAGGAVIVSRNAGATWSRVSSPTTEMLRAVAFAHDTSIVAVGDGGVILASSGGANWIKRSSGTSIQLRGVAFADGVHGAAVGGDDRRWRAASEILTTADAGATWTRVASPVKSRLYGVASTGKRFVAVGEDGTLLQANDRGTSWRRDTTVSGGGAWLGGVSLADETGIVVGAGGRILRSEHGGAWKPVKGGLKELSVPINAIARASSNVLIVAGGPPGRKTRGAILRSTDGGATFTKAKVDSVGPVIYVAFRDSLVGIATGASGAVLRTTDGGATWTRVSIETGRNLRMVAFADSGTAVIVGAFGTNSSLFNEHAMFRSRDAGRSWTPVPTGSHGIIMAVAFHGPMLGLAAGANGSILRSTDAGATWTRINQGITRTILRDITILDEKNVVVAGDEGIVLRSADGGFTWTKVESGVTTHFAAMRFADTRFGIAVGIGDRAIYTNDAGLHWNAIPLGQTLFLPTISVGSPTFVGGRGVMARLEPTQPAPAPTPTGRGGNRP